jgi:hypothetical protein
MAIVTKPLSMQVKNRVEQALAELRRRGATSDYCPRCNTEDWNVDIVTMPAYSVTQPQPGETRPGYLPTLNYRLQELRIHDPAQLERA